MITIREWMELVDYKITDGSDYGWDCYGSNAYALDSCNGVQGKADYSFSIIFSTKTQEVYEISVWDLAAGNAYRMVAPNHITAYEQEAQQRGVATNAAWDNVEYVDLEVVEDFMQKAKAIINGESYDTDVIVQLDLPDDLLLQAFQAAHAENITLNAYINKMLKSFIDQQK